ncbi:MAG: hypothetical protein M4D80_10605 [Myxococcota bacterium]|nr:hypothetical protein [Myxococcota bacterium]
MRRLALLVVMVGCGDDLSLQVDVEHPANADIERTVVSIYESPMDEVRCPDIEFQDVPDGVLAGLEVARFEQDSQGTTGSLDGISRTGIKLVVARGFRVNGMYFTAGCTEHGTIGGSDKVVVKTQVVAAVSLGGVESEGNDAGTIPITITTPLGAALPKRPISWRVYGYAGATPMSSPVALEVGTDEWQPTASTCTGQDGTIRLRPVPPAQIGGFAARVRVSWGQEAPRQFSSFTRAEPVRRDLGALATAQPTGRLCTPRTSGTTKRIVCIEDSDPGAAVTPIARDLSATVANGVVTLAVAGSQGFAPTESIASVYTVQAGANRDAYAITTLGRVIGLFSPSRPPNAAQGSFAGDGTVEEVMVIPSCQAQDPARLIVRTRGATQKLWVMDPLGGPHILFGNGFDTALGDQLRLNTAGCVTELQTDNAPSRRQVLILDQQIATLLGTVAYYDCSAPSGKCATRLPGVFGGVGFKRGGDGDEDRLVASSFDTTGTIISELIFLDAKVVERARISAASVPDRIVSGNLDGDDQTDLAWSFAAIAGSQTNFQVAYAREVDGEPLTALTGPKSVTVDDLFAAEVTGDAFDDIVIVSRSRDGTAPSGVSVIPARAPAAPRMVRADDTCQ